MINKTLGIIIVNYNSGLFLKECVDSIFNSSLKNISLRVVIVDNDSKDNSLDIERVEQDSLKIIRNTTNNGFGYACNQAREYLQDKEYLLLLNPDTVINKSTLIDSLDFLVSNEKISILGLCHLDEKENINPSCSRFPKVKNIIWDIVGLSKLFPKIFKPATVMTDFDHKTSCFVNQVMGAYMMMHKNIYDTLEGFDTRFFVYYEDADFAFRGFKKGYLSYYNSNIKITHVGRGTTAKISDISLFYNLRSRAQFVKKHYGRNLGNLIIFLTICVEPITRVLYNFFKNPGENKNTIKAIISFGKYYLRK